MEGEQADTLESLRQWTVAELRRKQPVFEQRIAAGFIRECHGDLHLGNLLFWNDEFLAFDAIEFNEDLRRIDTMNEVAFLVMDLDDRGYTAWARALLNAYLEITADYGGLSVLRLSMVYRALVRAKVSLIQQLQGSVGDRTRLGDEGWAYVEHAMRYAHPGQPRLTITHGLSGSGKTTGARNFIQLHGGILLRSDIIRQRFPVEVHEQPALNEGRYTAAMTARTYQRLEELSRSILTEGFSVVVDATFLRRDQRDLFRELAHQLKVPFQILEFDAPVDELRQRISNRTGDASEATLEVLESQLSNLEPIAADEPRDSSTATRTP